MNPTGDNEFASSILEQAAEAIVVCDEAGRIVLLNRVARELAGVSRIGDAFEAVLPLRVGDDKPFDLGPALKGEHLRGVECSLRECTLVLSAAPLEGAAGAVVTLTDITDRKRAERSLEDHAEQLERFAFGAAHDLQEPLRTILSYTQLLNKNYRQHADPEIEQLTQFIEGGVTRMRSLIKDLVSYSTVLQRPENSHRLVDLNVMLFVATGNCGHTIRETGAKVTNTPLPKVWGDETQLAQLFQHLIDNALKFSGERPVLHISAEPGSGLHAILFADKGSGIPQQYQEQIFGLFKRLHGKEIPGSGIGLALCKRIVELHNGRITVESEPGAGATFRVELPATPASER